MEYQNYFVFEQNKKRYALEVNNVVQVVQSVYVEPVVEEYENLHGVINYKGKIIPVFDFNSILQGKKSDIELNDQFVIVKVEDHYFSFHIQSSLGIERCKIIDQSDFDQSVEKFEIIKAMVEFEDQLLPLIDISLLFDNHKVKHISKEKRVDEK